MKNAYFAGGCFWCIANVFYDLDGVKEVVSGYSGGKEIDPKYEEVKSQLTSHRETIKITYDENKISYLKLLEKYFENIDPFDEGGQFIDRGHSYTLAVYVIDDVEQEIVTNFVKQKEKSLNKKMYISIEKFKSFYSAEEYHQKWSKKHPDEFNKELINSGRLK